MNPIVMLMMMVITNSCSLLLFSVSLAATQQTQLIQQPDQKPSMIHIYNEIDEKEMEIKDEELRDIVQASNDIIVDNSFELINTGLLNTFAADFGGADVSGANMPLSLSLHNAIHQLQSAPFVGASASPSPSPSSHTTIHVSPRHASTPSRTTITHESKLPLSTLSSSSPRDSSLSLPSSSPLSLSWSYQR
jgi:hypothetical protein